MMKDIESGNKSDDEDDDNSTNPDSSNPLSSVGSKNNQRSTSQSGVDDEYDSNTFISSGKYYGGGNEFDPKGIITQIIVIQSAYYCCLSGLVLVFFGLFDYPRNVSTLFNSDEYNLMESKGRLLLSLVFVSGFIISFCVSPVVERTKKCLDFVITLNVIHSLLCWIIVGFPTSWGFWSVHALAAIVTTLVSEWLCMQTELQEIILNKKSSQHFGQGKSPLTHHSPTVFGSSSASSFQVRKSDVTRNIHNYESLHVKSESGATELVSMPNVPSSVLSLSISNFSTTPGPRQQARLSHSPSTGSLASSSSTILPGTQNQHLQQSSDSRREKESSTHLLSSATITNGPNSKTTSPLTSFHEPRVITSSV